jgi:hypothetical protein
MKDSTIAKYNQLLKKLSTLKINYQTPKSFSSLLKEIKGLKKSDNINISNKSVRTYLSALAWYYDDKKINDDILNLLLKEISKINKEVMLVYDDNEMNDKEQNVYVDWTEVLNVFEKLKSIRGKSNLQYKNFITIALYTLMPPRRLKDYCEMIVVEEIPDDINDSCNYYVQNPPIFIFNNYKTNTTYGTQKINVNDELVSFLNFYVDSCGLINKKLLGNNENDLSKRIKRLFTKYTGKGATINTLRHSFVNHMNESGLLKTTKQQKELSIKMAHSHITQQNIYKKINT